FQWEKQDTYSELMRKQELLKSKITNRKIVYNYHDAKVSYLEAVFARGDRRLGKALALAAERGRKFDAWTECFDFEEWIDIFKEIGIDADFYATRGFGLDEVLPWDMIDCGVTKEFLARERAKAYESTTTPSCRDKCSACGANKLGGERKCCP
ncbi:MAG: B12-binding domain-containing radical SAM protein, partial [Clostridia bacterium]|nr:B12-binding domain-containing radical SAM protein [Clostridia bacterium]